MLADEIGVRFDVGVGRGAAAVIMVSGALLGVMALSVYFIKAVRMLEIAASIGISGMLMFFLGYQFVEIFQYGWMWQKLKIFLLVVPALAANFLYLIKKIRQKSTIEAAISPYHCLDCFPS